MKNNYDQYDLFKETDTYLTRPKFYTEREKRFYPSEASVKYYDKHGDLVTAGTCLRAAYFRLSDDFERAPSEPRTEYIFMAGRLLEQGLIDTWKKMGIWYDNNVKFVSKEHNVSGELDCLLIEPPSGTIYGVEVKTFYGYMAEKEIMGNKGQAGFPKINQLLQTLVYLYIFRERLAYFRMVYLARDSVKRRTFKIELHQEGDIFYPKVDGVVLRNFSVNQIFARYKELQDYVDKKIVPPNDYELQYPPEKVESYYKKGKVSKTKYDKWSKGKLGKYEYVGDWECAYCPYRNVCWGDNAPAPTEEDSETTES